MKQLTFIVLLLFSVSICTARKYKFAVDSIDAATKEHVRVVEYKIGGHDFHTFGKLAIEQRGDKYYIIFPLVLYVDASWYSKPEDEIISKGTTITIKLDNGAILESQTEQDNNASWHYLWRYDITEATRHGTTGGGNGTDVTVYKWHDNRERPETDESYYNIYALEWLAKFEFASSDMQLIGKHRIVDAYSMKKFKKITLPIKHKQSKRIQKSVAALFRK